MDAPSGQGEGQSKSKAYLSFSAVFTSAHPYNTTIWRDGSDSDVDLANSLCELIVSTSRFRLEHADKSSFLMSDPIIPMISGGGVLLCFGCDNYMSPLLFLRVLDGCVDIWFSPSSTGFYSDREYFLWFSGYVHGPEFDLGALVRRFDLVLFKWRFSSAWSVILITGLFYFLLSWVCFRHSNWWQGWVFFGLGCFVFVAAVWISGIRRVFVRG